MFFSSVALAVAPLYAQYSSNPFLEHAHLKAEYEMGHDLSEEEVERLNHLEQQASKWLGEDFQAAVKAAAEVVKSSNEACAKICSSEDKKESLECFEKCTTISEKSTEKIEGMLEKFSDVSISREAEKSGILGTAINAIRGAFSEEPAFSENYETLDPCPSAGFFDSDDSLISHAPGSSEWMESAGGLFSS